MGRRSSQSRDRIIVAELTGAAQHHVRERTDRDAAIDDLRELASGRADLLALAAGHEIGAFLGDSFRHQHHSLAAADLLVAAGADVDLVPAAADEVRARAARDADAARAASVRRRSVGRDRRH